MSRENRFLSRRDLLKTCAAVPLLSSGAHTMAVSSSLALRPRAIVINGKPVFLVSGCIDYFRCPHQLWHDRLLKAKRAGLNTVATYVA